MGLINWSEPHAADAAVPRHGAMLPHSVLGTGQGSKAGWSMALQPRGNWHKAQLIWGFVNAPVKHHTHSIFVYLVSQQHFYKALTVRHSGELGGKGGMRNARAAGWDRLYESRRQTVAPYLLYETSKATVTRQMDSTCRHSKSRNLALFVWCILKEMESH